MKQATIRRILCGRRGAATAGALVAAAALAGLVGTALATRQISRVGHYVGSFAPRVQPDLCVDVPRGELTEGTEMIVWPCHGGENQRLELSWSEPGQIRVMPDRTDHRGYAMCLDYYPSAGRVGDPVRIWPCHPLARHDTQRWRPRHQQFRAASGWCLGVEGGAASARGGERVVLVRCWPSTQFTDHDWSGGRY